MFALHPDTDDDVRALAAETYLAAPGARTGEPMAALVRCGPSNDRPTAFGQARTDALRAVAHTNSAAEAVVVANVRAALRAHHHLLDAATTATMCALASTFAGSLDELVQTASSISS